jgi:hypothetical protein
MPPFAGSFKGVATEMKSAAGAQYAKASKERDRVAIEDFSSIVFMVYILP